MTSGLFGIVGISGKAPSRDPGLSGIVDTSATYPKIRASIYLSWRRSGAAKAFCGNAINAKKSAAEVMERPDDGKITARSIAISADIARVRGRIGGVPNDRGPLRCIKPFGGILRETFSGHRPRASARIGRVPARRAAGADD